MLNGTMTFVLMAVALALGGCAGTNQRGGLFSGNAAPPPLTAQITQRREYARAIEAIQKEEYERAVAWYQKVMQPMSKPRQVPAEVMAGYTRCLIEMGDYRDALNEIKRYEAIYRLSDELKQNRDRARRIGDVVQKYAPRGTIAPPEAFEKAILANRGNRALWKELVHAYAFNGHNGNSSVLAFQLAMLELPDHPEREEEMDEQMVHMIANGYDPETSPLILIHAVQGLEKGDPWHHRAEFEMAVKAQFAYYTSATLNHGPFPAEYEALIEYGWALDLLTQPNGWSSNSINDLLRHAQRAARMEPQNPHFAHLAEQVEKNQDAILKERYATNDRWEAQTQATRGKRSNELLRDFAIGVAIGGILAAISPHDAHGAGRQKCGNCDGTGQVFNEGDMNNPFTGGWSPCPYCVGGYK